MTREALVHEKLTKGTWHVGLNLCLNTQPHTHAQRHRIKNWSEYEKRWYSAAVNLTTATRQLKSG